MDLETKLILGMVVFVVVIIARYYLWLRSTPPMDEKTLAANRVALFMFVVHALFFFEGAFLMIQLSNIAALFALCQLQHMGKISKASPVASK